MQDYMIVDANKLIEQIAMEFPDEMNETYYALRMVQEMIEADKIPCSSLLQKDAQSDAAEDCCEKKPEPSADSRLRKYCVEIEAKDVQGFRNQLGEVWAYTYSEGFEEAVASGKPFEYDTKTGALRIGP